MEQLKTELLNNNGEKIKEIIKTKLISDGYDENCINDILENIVINDKSGTTNGTVTPPPPGHDKTQYKFLGKTYGKNRLVLAVINDYIQRHDDCTLESLQTTFPGRLQGSLGVVDTYENANKIYARTNHKRHFLNNIITLRNGQQIVVCKEWGIGYINRFINKAREIGYNIEKINIFPE